MDTMDGVTGIERRDPASGLIQLGIVLCRAQKLRQSGLLRVEDQGHVHVAHLTEGRIAEVQFGGEDNGKLRSKECKEPLAERLFDLMRPKVLFEEKRVSLNAGAAISADKVVLHGVSQRGDLFDPRPLSERIPVETLQLNQESLYRAARFDLSESERAFIESLLIPTPVAMALWKRGLSPRHAGALLVALNVLGFFPAWEPGDLPRISAVTKLLRKMRDRSFEHEILGVPEDASREEIDRAFRKLSFQLHPDRLPFISEKERRDATEAFEALSAAHAKMKGSRRRPKVRASCAQKSSGISTEQEGSWSSYLIAARQAAADGLRRQAATFVIRALSLAPPPGIIAELKSILKACSAA